MSYKNQECDTVTKYRLLTKQDGLTNRDICLITGCSSPAATKMINAIHERISETGKIPVVGRVSAKAFLAFKEWDFEEIQQLAFAEMKALQKAVG